MNKITIEDGYTQGKDSSKNIGFMKNVANHLIKKVNILGFILPVVVILYWLSIGWFKVLPNGLVPTPVEVIKSIYIWGGGTSLGGISAFYYDKLYTDMYMTIFRLVIGYLLATMLGITAGIGIGMSKIIDYTLTPTFRILGPIPPITIFPIAIIIFGLGSQTNIFLTFYGAFFPIMAASVSSVMSVHRDLLRVGRMLGYGRLGIIWKVILPAALPGIVGSLRIGLGLAWMMEITSEMMGVHSGLGYTLWNAYNYFDYPAVYASMLIIGFLGFLSDYLVRKTTSKLLSWHASTGVRS